MVLRHELWNGNREPLSNLLSLDPQRSVIAWAWTQHGAYRERYLGVMADPAWAHLRFVTLTSDAETASFLATAT